MGTCIRISQRNPNHTDVVVVVAVVVRAPESINAILITQMLLLLLLEWSWDTCTRII